MREADQENRRLMSNPASWPRWPILPVKRSIKDSYDIECGMILAVQGYLTTVIRVSFYEFNPPSGVPFVELIKELPHTKYDSLDELLADGWVVD